MSEHDYPHHGSCDACAEGPQPLREADPETEAWICRACTDRDEEAVKLAAYVMGVSVRVAEAGITAYHAHLTAQETRP